MATSSDLQFKLQAAVGLANGLESELENKESLLKEAADKLRTIQESAAELIRRIDSNLTADTVRT